MTTFTAALAEAKQACVATKRVLKRLNELNELMAQGKFAEADLLMAELDAELAELKAK